MRHNGVVLRDRRRRRREGKSPSLQGFNRTKNTGCGSLVRGLDRWLAVCPAPIGGPQNIQTLKDYYDLIAIRRS